LQITNIRKYAILSDLHIPYQDNRAYDLALDIIEDSTKHSDLTIILNGDAADLLAFSMHGANKLSLSLDYEIEEVAYQLERIRQRFKGAELIYNAGNHEDRAERYVLNNCKQLLGHVKIEKLFRVKEAGFKWVPYNSNQAFAIPKTDILVKHCPLSSSANAENFNLRSGKTIISAHLHRMSHKYGRVLDAKTGSTSIQSILCGCLVDFDSPAFDYMNKHPNVSMWTQGFCIVTCIDTKKETQYFIDNVPIHKKNDEYVCFYEGNLWTN
jgi:hypothetical protein